LDIDAAVSTSTPAGTCLRIGLDIPREVLVLDPLDRLPASARTVFVNTSSFAGFRQALSQFVTIVPQETNGEYELIDLERRDRR
jgi:hypothetical protein